MRATTSALIANVRAAVADPEALAMIGLGSSKQAKTVFEAAGGEIKGSGIPFLSNISITSIFADYPNVFTTRASQDDERIPVIVQFVKQIGATRPAFIGIKDSLFSDTLAEGLNGASGATALVADHRLGQTEGKLDPAEVAAAVGDLKQKNPDLVFLTVGSRRSAAMMKALMAAGVTPALFITGRIESIPSEIVRAYPSDLYQVAWEDLPDVYNDRLRQLVTRSNPKQWIFAGRKIPEAPGWASGECKPRADEAWKTPFAADNLRAIRIGGQYADMIGLIAAAARSAAPSADVAQLRAQVIDQIKTTYAAGRGTFQGRFDNWSFRSSTRAAARTPFIVQLVHGRERTQLAPVQFVRLRDNSLRPVNTLYLDIDLIRAFRIDDNEKSFFAEFYLAMHDEGKGTSIEDIDFSNAFLDPRTNDRQLTVRVLNNGGKSAAYPDDMKIYHVAGRFMFEPEFANYPFDTQRFSIDIRPKRDDAPFIVQPPPRCVAGPVRRHRRLGAEGAVRRLRRGFRADDRRQEPRAEHRAVLQGVVRVADGAADDRLLSARGGAAWRSSCSWPTCRSSFRARTSRPSSPFRSRRCSPPSRSIWRCRRSTPTPRHCRTASSCSSTWRSAS